MRKLKEQNVFSVTFFLLKSRPLANGELPIYVSLYYMGKQVHFSCKKSVALHNWDLNKCTVKSSYREGIELNADLNFIKESVYNLYFTLVDLQIPITAQKIKERFLHADNDVCMNKNIGFVSYFQRYLENVKSKINIDYTEGTYKKYRTTFNHVKTFIQLKQREDDIPFALLTPTIINSLQDYIRVDKKCSHNSTIKYMKNIKKVTTMALNEGLMDKNPFRGIRFKFEDTDTTYLDENELRLLEDQSFANYTLSNVRDIFVFCCYTGLAYIDVVELNASHIFEDKGRLYINKRRKKTKQMSTIPIFKPALKIIEKYEDHPLARINKVIIPVLSNQKMNQYLKQIAEMCDIRKNLTTHVARHTFATTVTLANGISKDVVAKMLGHSSTRMTDRYARVTNDLVLKSTRDLSNMLQ